MNFLRGASHEPQTSKCQNQPVLTELSDYITQNKNILREEIAISNSATGKNMTSCKKITIWNLPVQSGQQREKRHFDMTKEHKTLKSPQCGVQLLKGIPLVVSLGFAAKRNHKQF